MPRLASRRWSGAVAGFVGIKPSAQTFRFPTLSQSFSLFNCLGTNRQQQSFELRNWPLANAPNLNNLFVI